MDLRMTLIHVTENARDVSVSSQLILRTQPPMLSCLMAARRALHLRPVF